jgi:hypothetical protein
MGEGFERSSRVAHYRWTPVAGEAVGLAALPPSPGFVEHLNQEP